MRDSAMYETIGIEDSNSVKSSSKTKLYGLFGAVFDCRGDRGVCGAGQH